MKTSVFRYAFLGLGIFLMVLGHAQRYLVSSVCFLPDSRVTGMFSEKDAKMCVNDGILSVLYLRSGSPFLVQIRIKTGQLVDSFPLAVSVTEMTDVRNIAYSPENKVLSCATFDTLYRFDLKNHSVRKMATNCLSYTEFLADGLLLGTYYNYHILDRVYPMSLYRMDEQLNILDSLSLKPDFIEYTHYLPRHLITASQSHVAFPLLGEYGVVICNTGLNVIDTLKREVDGWVSPSIELSQSINSNNLNFYFPLLDQENFQRINRIEHVQFLNDSLLLVRWFDYDSTLSPLPLRYVDVFSITQNSGSIEYVLIKSFRETVPKFDTNAPLDSVGFPVSSSDNSIYFPEGLIQVKPDYSPLDLTGMDYRAYYRQKEDRALIDTPQLAVWIMRWSE